MTDVTVAHLCDRPDMVDTLVRWFEEEWAPWYGPDGAGDARSDLAACSDPDRIPICRIAITQDGQLAGTASLRSDSVGSDQHPGPWLTALLVDPAHRRQGIGSTLVAAVEADARRLGFPELYVSTDTAHTMLERRGWRPVGSAPSLRGATTVYVLGLQ